MKRFKYDLAIYIILAVIGLAAGILLLIPKVAQDVLYIVIAVALLAYVVLFLAKRMFIKGSTLKVMLAIIETAFIILIVLGLFLIQFKVFKFTDQIIAILGLVLWIRGLMDMILGFFSSRNKKFRTIMFIVDVILLTLGTYLFAAPFVTNETIIYVLVGIFFLIAAVCILLTILCFTKGKKKAAAK